MKNTETVRRAKRVLWLMAQACKLAAAWLGVWACAGVNWAAHSTSAGQLAVRVLALAALAFGALALAGWAYAADEEYRRAARVLARMEQNTGRHAA